MLDRERFIAIVELMHLAAAHVNGTKRKPAVTAVDVVEIGGASAFPRSELGFQNMFWSERMMIAMDSNKEGMASGNEFMSYMGKQDHRMDAGNNGIFRSRSSWIRR